LKIFCENKGVTFDSLKALDERLNTIKDEIAYQIEIDVKYRGYTDRQFELVAKTRKLDGRRIPAGLDYGDVSGLTREAVERFARIKPSTLGQASRIPGVTPASITALLVHFKKTGIL
jgi:tRNA uridine 5-carboxymethylaminomethyl modification enzyme